MLSRYLAFAFGACLIAVLIASPSQEDSVREGAQTAEIASDYQLHNSQAGARTADWYAGEHTLPRQSDGHFYADATVGGTSIRMMVDTGASVIALTGQDAISAGLHWYDADVRRIGTGASGAVYGVPARIKQIEIGGMTRYDVDAVIIPEGLEISLLGQSYLSQIGSVRIADDRMIMGSR
ncbi:retropepsin-like aspartic protease family protein [Altererythrobacter lutimaris]|uniref:TIGR02281 family clan AA aspartic protease n=1 Tax=Altererythrobacter lutimaris TaxID=2743979 RepID=A0A850HDD1_9SPHN|nr:TIGR02281 family clan AA aspartic protease [Altererythrobacter lutimaris]NVE95819.1 TIGR02281 family clan AA aspartic protease [Altererythrobacter lutimaris]